MFNPLDFLLHPSTVLLRRDSVPKHSFTDKFHGRGNGLRLLLRMSSSRRSLFLWGADEEEESNLRGVTYFVGCRRGRGK